MSASGPTDSDSFKKRSTEQGATICVTDDANTTDEDDAESCKSNESSGPDISLGTSVVQYYGSGSSFCGYCKQEGGQGRRSYDYQDLLDRNWRRSGTYSYCPINQTTCCPNYAAICKAKDFKLTRSQRKCIARVNSYLATGDPKGQLSLRQPIGLASDGNQVNSKVITIDDLEASSKLRHRRLLRSCDRKAKLYGKTREDALKDRQEKWRNKLQASQTLENCLYPQKDALTTEGESLSAEHVLHIDMVHVDSRRCRSSRDDQHQVLMRYQEAVHNETRRRWTMKRFCDFLVSTPLITEPLTTFDYVSEEAPIEDDAMSNDVNSFNRTQYLLVKPPQLPTAYGTYHCNYHLDDKLIATGVLDVLPKCITTVYFFYDPDYDFLNMGIYSALVEISMIRQMDKHFVKLEENSENQLVNYYLGFYVPECKKMHYKTRFKPSYLLCSKTFRYVPTETCLEKLSDRKYADFADGGQDEDYSMKELVTIPIISPIEGLENSLMEYLWWLEMNLGPDYNVILVNGYLHKYASLVGLSLLPKLTLRVNVVHRTLLERYKRIIGDCEPRSKALTA